MTNHWYSEEMKEFHYANKTSEYLVYHWYYTGFSKGWTPSSFRWGGVGIGPYPTLDLINQRYDIEGWEVGQGLRKSERFMLKMIRILDAKNQLGLKLIDSGLSRTAALDIENFLRPEGYNNKFDKRIWNTVAGGEL
jgi:hypothetical protein